MLERATGPVCAKCGCNDCERLYSEVRRGVVFDRWECTNCYYSWMVADAEQFEDRFDSEPDVEVVYIRRLKCPKCRSIRVRTHTTTNVALPRGVAIVRYHRCLDCEQRFKTVENP